MILLSLLMSAFGVSGRSLTVNMQRDAYLGETANESKGIRLD